MKFQDLFKKRKLNKKIGVPLFILVGGFFIFFGLKNYYDYRTFLECSKESKAIVINKYTNTSGRKSNRSTRYNIRVKYTANSIIHKTQKSLYREDYDKLNIGDTIRIKYSCKNPNWTQYSDMRNKIMWGTIPKS